MSDELPRHRTLDSLKKEAKRWLRDLRDGSADARARLDRALPNAPTDPTLRDVQHALAREQGLPGWAALKSVLASERDVQARALAHYELMAEALLEAYQTGTPEAMERHYRHTWHRRPWQGMRVYVQLDLDRRPATPDDDVPITIDDARYLIAIEHGFPSWDALRSFTESAPARQRLAIKPVRLVARDVPDEPPTIASTRDWDMIIRLLAEHPEAGLAAEGQMTDDVLADVGGVERVTALDLSGSKALSDDGVRQLARLPCLEQLDLSGTAITDASLDVLRHLPRLEKLSLAGTRVTDAGVRHLADCHELREINLMWTQTGDAALRALAGKAKLHQLATGNLVTDEGLALLHELPVFKTWHAGEIRMALTSYRAMPNHLTLRGPFSDRGMQQLRGLDGLFGLNLDDSQLRLTAAALPPLVELPNLGWLGVDAKDDWMFHIARMPKLRFLGAQDTTAGDDGFEALSESQSLEYIWGRRCHNLRRRGFMALSNLPRLRGLSVSCLNVDDVGVSSLPAFPALRELMPMDVPDAGYRHIGKCEQLDSLVLMYCRDTTDAATEHITRLRHLTYYFNSYTTISDRTPQLLSKMDSLERVTFDSCHHLTNAGIAALARLPRLRELRIAGRGLTPDAVNAFPPRVRVHYFS